MSAKTGLPVAAGKPGRGEWHGCECCQGILDALPFYVLLVDELHTIAGANHKVTDHYGVEALCGSFCPRVIHGVDAFPGCPLEEAVAGNRPVETEFYDRPKQRWMYSALYPTTLKSAEGRQLFLHFARDISKEKEVEAELSRSLEHHQALSLLLGRLNSCSSTEDCVDALLDVTLGLSWMGLGKRALAFLMDGDELRLIACRNIAPLAAERCQRVPRGQCVCGQVADTSRPLFLSGAAMGDPALGHESSDGHGHASIPLAHEGRVLGVATFYLNENQELDARQSAFLQAAGSVASASMAQQISRREVREAQERAAVLERKLLERVLNSQEEERKRLARDLHDDLGQAMSVLLLELSQTPLEGLTTEFRNHLAESIRELTGKVYGLSRDLRPAILDDLGLDSAVARYVAALSARTGLAVDYQFACAPGLDPRMDPRVELQLYRITQEALSNVARHAEASRASVILLRRAEEVTLMVEDDGRGFDVRATHNLQGPGGLGLTGMRERMELVGGKFLVDSAPDRGTSIKATIPLAGTPR